MEIKCGTCDKLCRESDKTLLCHSCDRHFHIVCQKVSDAKYEVLSADASEENPTMLWFCNSSCNIFARKFICSITDIRQNLDVIKNQVDNVASKVSKVDGRVNSIERGVFRKEHAEGIRRIAREEIETEMSARPDESDRAQLVEQKFEEAVSAAVQEINQREYRKRSLIIHGVKMSESKSLRNRIDHDANYLQNLFKEGMGIKEKISPKKVARLGKKSDKDRPMKVNLDSPQQVRDILNAAKNLKDKEEYQNVSVTTDKTPFERAEWRKLVRLREQRQAMSDQAQDGSKWIIVGMRVVKDRTQETDSEDDSNGPPSTEGGS